MFEHDYRAKFDEIAPDRALVEGTRDRMRKALSGEKARPRRLTRRGLVAAAAAAVRRISACSRSISASSAPRMVSINSPLLAEVPKA